VSFAQLWDAVTLALWVFSVEVLYHVGRPMCKEHVLLTKFTLQPYGTGRPGTKMSSEQWQFNRDQKYLQ
jgi:hypothetical protein